jgi:hypothetical protein
MLTTFPSAWLLLGLPFISSGAISGIRPLRRLVTRATRLTWWMGIAGLILLVVGLVGLLPAEITWSAMLAGGAVSGFAMFMPKRTDGGSDGDDWRRRRPPPDDPPPPEPSGGGPFDWELFDRLRAGWERTPVRTG